MSILKCQLFWHRSRLGEGSSHGAMNAEARVLHLKNKQEENEERVSTAWFKKFVEEAKFEGETSPRSLLKRQSLRERQVQRKGVHEL